MHPFFRTLMTAVPLLVALIWYVARRQAAAAKAAAPRPLPNRMPTDTRVLLFGTRLVDDGVQFFPDWSTAMVREFDDVFDGEQLARWHQQSLQLSQLPQHEWRAAIQRMARNTEDVTQ